MDVLEASPSGWAVPRRDHGQQRELDVQAKLRHLAEAYRYGCIRPSEWQLANEHLKADRILGHAYHFSRSNSDKGQPQAEGSHTQAHVNPGHLHLHSHLLPHGAPQPPARPQRVLMGEEMKQHAGFVSVMKMATMLLVDPLGMTAAWLVTDRSPLEQRAASFVEHVPSGRVHVQMLQDDQKQAHVCKEQSFSLDDLVEIMPSLPYHALAGLVDMMEGMRGAGQQGQTAQPGDHLPSVIQQRSRLLYQHGVEPGHLLGVVWVRWLPGGPAAAADNHLDVRSAGRVSWSDLAHRRLPALPERDRHQGLQFDTALWAEAQMKGCRSSCIPSKLLGCLLHCKKCNSSLALLVLW